MIFARCINKQAPLLGTRKEIKELAGTRKFGNSEKGH